MRYQELETPVEQLLLPSEQNRLDEFDRWMLDQFEIILNSGNKEGVRRFLTLRGIAISQSSLDFTLNPNLPLNQFYLKIAAEFRKPEESICKILMPTLSSLIGTMIDSSDLQSIEVDNQLLLHEFLINADGTALICVPDLMEIAKSNPNYVFPIHDKQTIQHVGRTEKTVTHYFSSELSAMDRERIKVMCGEKSQIYFDVLAAIHRQFNNEKPSVGHALINLATALLKGSNLQNASELTAEFNECYLPILEFYKHWLALSIETKNKIKDYRPENNIDSKCSLESQLLCLFYNVDMPLSEAEYSRAKIEDVLPCVKQIGDLLTNLLSAHMDLCDIPLPGYEKEFIHESLPTTEALNKMHQDFISALPTRELLPLANNQDFFTFEPFVRVLIENLSSNATIDKQIEDVAKKINGLADLRCALLLLPSKHWTMLFRTIDQRLKSIMKPDSKSWDAFVYLLEAVGVKQWKVFCNSFSRLSCCGEILTVTDLTNFIFRIAEKNHPALKDAMALVAFTVFKTGLDVAKYFNQIDYSMWEKFYKMYDFAIESVLIKVNAITDLYAKINHGKWAYLTLVLKSIMIEHLKKLNFLEDFLRAFFPEFRIHFIDAIFPILTKEIVDKQFILNMMRLINKAEWYKIFKKLSISIVDQVFQSEDDVEFFLTQLTLENNKVAFVDALRESSPGFKITLHAFYRMLLNHPSCQYILFKVFYLQIPDIFSELFSLISLHRSLNVTIQQPILDVFAYFLNNGLATLLSESTLEKISPTFVSANKYMTTDTFFRCMSKDFTDLDQSILEEPMVIWTKKIKLLADFFERHFPEDSVERLYQLKFKAELMNVFGSNFISRFTELMSFASEYETTTPHIAQPCRDSNNVPPTSIRSNPIRPLEWIVRNRNATLTPEPEPLSTQYIVNRVEHF